MHLSLIGHHRVRGWLKNCKKRIDEKIQQQGYQCVKENVLLFGRISSLQDIITVVLRFFFPLLHRSTSRRTAFKMFPPLCFKPQARTLCCCPNLKKIIIVQQSQGYTHLPSNLQCLVLTRRLFWNWLLFCGSFKHRKKRTGERRSCELHTSFKTPSRLLLSPKCFSSFHYLQPLSQTTHISIQTQVKRQDKQKGAVKETEGSVQW